MANKKEKYYEGVGGRKTSSARVRIYPNQKDSDYIINEKTVEEYFQTKNQEKKAKAALEAVDEDGMKVTVLVEGGGMNSQADAIRHGLARALEDYNEEYRKKLKSLGYLTRDARKKERKKPGKRGARRSPQWRKR
ncbi:MAG: 30S ribosomal protein S9 [Patescibacteria group bacterium]